MKKPGSAKVKKTIQIKEEQPTENNLENSKTEAQKSSS